MRGRTRLLPAVACTGLLAIALFEIGARLWLPPREVRNSDGFRGPDRARPRPADVYRILAVGDSVVEATDLGYEQIWTRTLEDSLTRAFEAAGSSRRFARAEVINAGVDGYESWQVAARLQDRGLKYDPNLVVVLVGWNDMFSAWLPDWRPGPAPSDGPDRSTEARTDWPTTLKRGAIQYSSLARLIQRIRHPREPLAPVEPVEAPAGDRPRVPFNQAALEAYASNLERIHDLVIRAGSSMMIVAFPTLRTRDLVSALAGFPTPPTLADHAAAYARYQAAIRQFAAQHPEVVLADAAGAFSSRPEQQQVELFASSEHLSAAGHRLLAGVIKQSLEARGLVP